jgi:hypothetical protein
MGAFHLRNYNIDAIKFEGHVACCLGSHALCHFLEGILMGTLSFTKLTRLNCNTHQIKFKVQVASAVHEDLCLALQGILNGTLSLTVLTRSSLRGTVHFAWVIKQFIPLIKSQQVQTRSRLGLSSYF